MSQLVARLQEPGALRLYLQPILELVPEPALYAYEALTRGPVDSSFENSEVLFEYVRRKGLEDVFDRLCIGAAFRASCALPAAAGLFLNVHASTLERDLGFPDFLAAAREAVPRRAVCLELVEHSPVWQTSRLGHSLDRIRQQGISIAVDDLGAGQSTLRMLLDIRPDVVKIDRSLVIGAAGDRHRRVMLVALCSIAASFGSRVIAEGIETEADLAAVRACGVTHGQGYLLGHPFPAEATSGEGLAITSQPLAAGAARDQVTR